MTEDAFGIDDPARSILVVSHEPMATCFFKKGAFIKDELELFNNYCNQYKFERIYYPGIKANNPFSNSIKSIRDGMEKEFYEKYPFNVAPTTDDKPFFFDFFKWDLPKKFSLNLSGVIGSEYDNPLGHLILVFLFMVSTFMSVTFIILPLFALPQDKRGSERNWSLLVLAFCLGMGFMLIEITLMQKFVLFLGHPIYSISVVLFSLLIFAGLGSLLAGRIFKNNLISGIIISAVVVSVLVLLYKSYLPWILNSALFLPLSLRIFVSVILILPFALVMGMPFPCCLTLSKQESPNLVSWIWGVNFTASVIGSVLCIILAMNFGFTFVLGLASVIYALGACWYLLFNMQKLRHSVS
jgi:hypothetical protein